MKRISFLPWVAALLLASCASPPLSLYTLGTSPAAPEAAPLGSHPMVITVARVTMPDELDTEDLVVRDGSTLRRSTKGRWASRMSLGITDRLTQRLAERRPDALVTDRPLADTPTDRIQVNIGRLDVTAAGTATLDADWVIVPRDPKIPTRRDRGHFTATGPVANDADVVALLGKVLDQLAAAIQLGRP
ncbi:membrane integrity-associated transporter subunit PqiC [Acidisphaera sp. S103]|uniref:PqiC family protein n=1 Tax=Acidisphaera sp. S103 TaxID=1747223 RepID=UPI00131D908F|nr:PqiC family protein [Acidisphaera sp. S103]